MDLKWDIGLYSGLTWLKIVSRDGVLLTLATKVRVP